MKQDLVGNWWQDPVDDLIGNWWQDVAPKAAPPSLFQYGGLVVVIPANQTPLTCEELKRGRLLYCQENVSWYSFRQQ